VVVARELTKVHEEFLRGTAGEVSAVLEARDAAKGEITLLIGKGSGVSEDTTPLPDAVAACVGEGMRRMDAIKTVAHRRGMSKREVYSALEKVKGCRGQLDLEGGKLLIAIARGIHCDARAHCEFRGTGFPIVFQEFRFVRNAEGEALRLRAGLSAVEIDDQFLFRHGFHGALESRGGAVVRTGRGGGGYRAAAPRGVLRPGRAGHNQK